MKADVPPSSWGEVQITIEKAFMETRYDWLAKGSKHDPFFFLSASCIDLAPVVVIPLFMEKKDLKNLETLYQLFSRLGASKNLCAAFKEYALVRFLRASSYHNSTFPWEILGFCQEDRHEHDRRR